MSHKDGRVVLSAWVEPVLRDYAREAARAAGVEFSRWVEGAVQRAVAEQSAEKALRIYPVHASNLTDVVTALEEERNTLKARVASMMDSISMACEEPQTGCECAGCSYARERGGDCE